MHQKIREVVLSTVMQKQAEERSMARRAVLKKVAYFPGSGVNPAVALRVAAPAAAYGSAVMPAAAFAVAGPSIGRSIRHGADKLTGGAMTRGLERIGDRVGGFIGRTWQGAVNAAGAGVRDARLEREADNAFNSNWQTFNGSHDPYSMARFRQQYISNKRRSMATRRPMQMPTGSVPYQPR